MHIKICSLEDNRFCPDQAPTKIGLDVCQSCGGVATAGAFFIEGKFVLEPKYILSERYNYIPVCKVCRDVLEGFNGKA